MFDIAPSEFMLVAFVALIVIGPKDLPKAMRFLGHWVGKARGVARQFRSGFDEMVREAELADMEKRWAAENERIMREHPADPSPEAATQAIDHQPVDHQPADHGADHSDVPVHVEQPAIVAAAPAMPPPPADRAPS